MVPALTTPAAGSVPLPELVKCTWKAGLPQLTFTQPPAATEGGQAAAADLEADLGTPLHRPHQVKVTPGRPAGWCAGPQAGAAQAPPPTAQLRCSSPGRPTGRCQTPQARARASISAAGGAVHATHSTDLQQHGSAGCSPAAAWPRHGSAVPPSSGPADCRAGGKPSSSGSQHTGGGSARCSACGAGASAAAGCRSPAAPLWRGGGQVSCVTGACLTRPPG